MADFIADARSLVDQNPRRFTVPDEKLVIGPNPEKAMEVLDVIALWARNTSSEEVVVVNMRMPLLKRSLERLNR